MFPEVSLQYASTEYVPGVNSDKGWYDSVIVSTATLSYFIGDCQLTTIEAEPGGICRVNELGQVMEGGSLSSTVILNEQILTFRKRSVTMYLTAVVPIGNKAGGKY